MTNLTTLLRDLQLKVTRCEPALIGGALGQAADEIERLRAALRECRGMVGHQDNIALIEGWLAGSPVEPCGDQHG